MSSLRCAALGAAVAARCLAARRLRRRRGRDVTAADRRDDHATTTGGDDAPKTGETASGGVELTEIGSFDAPLYVDPARGRRRRHLRRRAGRHRPAGRPDGEQRRSSTSPTRSRAGGEQGLLSVAFAPDYEQSGQLYVDYTEPDGDTRVVEYPAADGVVDESSARELLAVDQPYPNHNGGLVLFGPDGKLYIGLGDGGSGGDPERRGLDLSTLLGKILRIDPEPDGDLPYTIPADNPFVGTAGARAEIYSYGLRNPWRFAFDRETEDLTIGDVGQDTRGGDRLVGRGRGLRGELRLVGLRGQRALQRGPELARRDPARARLSHGDGNCSITGGLRGSRPEPSDPLRPLPLRRPSVPANCGASFPARGNRRRTIGPGRGRGPARQLR